MNKKKLLIVLVILIIAGSVIVYLALQKSSNNNSNGKIGVIVSLGPEVEWVNAVGGDKVNVSLMVPSGSDPHTYEPLPNQLTQVSNAKMYIEIKPSFSQLINNNKKHLIVRKSTAYLSKTI